MVEINTGKLRVCNTVSSCCIWTPDVRNKVCNLGTIILGECHGKKYQHSRHTAVIEWVGSRSILGWHRGTLCWFPSSSQHCTQAHGMASSGSVEVLHALIYRWPWQVPGLSVRPSVCPFHIRLSVRSSLSICHRISVSVSIYLYVSLSLCQSVSMSVRPYPCGFTFLCSWPITSLFPPSYFYLGSVLPCLSSPQPDSQKLGMACWHIYQPG